MLLIDYYAYNNKLSGFHPGEKFLFFSLTLAICLSLHSMAISLAVILLMAAVVLIAGVPYRFYIKLLLIPTSFLVVGVLTVALSVSREMQDFIWFVPIGSWGLGVTAANLELALNLFMRCLGAVSCLYFLSLTTPLTDIMLVLKKMRLPALVMEMMVLIYRFIFILLDVAVQIITAQQSRLGYINLRRGWHALSRLILSLFVISYQQSQVMYDALVARCYTGRINSLEEGYGWSRRNLVLILLVDSALLVGYYLQEVI